MTNGCASREVNDVLHALTILFILSVFTFVAITGLIKRTEVMLVLPWVALCALRSQCKVQQPESRN